MSYVKLVNGIDVPMTPEEIAQRQAEEAAWAEKQVIAVKLEKRRKALAEKWPDAFDIIDDILERGIDVVKAERTAIKEAHPKT